MQNPLRFLVLCMSFVFSAFICHGQNSIITTFFTGHACPGYLASDTLNNVFVTNACTGSNNILKVSQTGIVSRVAGDSAMSGFSGDGGPATAALLNGPTGIVANNGGNIIFADFDNFRIRKINSTGIITTIAGNGTSGYSGDGGPAISCELTSPRGISIDVAGNIYITDEYYSTIRKINTAGIVTTIAGGGTAGLGDGGPATAAQLFQPTGIALDVNGNIYVADRSNSRIRRIDTSGIITTIAGNGTVGFTGDGGPATAAEMNDPSFVAIDRYGNIYIADVFNYRIRKINKAGIISTVAGNGIGGTTGDGGNPLFATIAGCSGITFDKNNNLYIACGSVRAIRKVTTTPDVVANNFAIYINRFCDHVEMEVISKSTSALTVKTYFGDQSSDVSAMSVYGNYESLDLVHFYANPGNYTVKMVLFRGTTPIDSTKFSYTSLLCNTMPVKFYHDANNNCKKDSEENFIYLPTMAEVDSNGVAIDTISSTSGFYYTAYGNPGDIYSFRVISVPPGLHITCPSTPIVYDTLQLIQNIDNTRYMAMECTSAMGFDLAENVSLISGRHTASGTVIVNNAYCHAASSTLTLSFSPKYIFGSSYPMPSSVTGNTVSWNLGAVSLTAPQPVVHFTLDLPTTYWLTPGDTVTSNYTVNPIAGDLDTVNNHSKRNDTVKGSYDPNELSVSPSGFILPGTQLTYTISFENTGNDTAFNIYVMDTLPDEVDVHSLHIVAASATMNIALLKAGGHNIVKFDFPNINLLDSSHHNQCDGLVIFKINTKRGVPDCRNILNQAGIFFDDNPVVMTNTVDNIIIGPNPVAGIISGPDTVCVGMTATLSDTATGGVWNSSSALATVSAGVVTAVSAGIDTIGYTVINGCGTAAIAQKVVTIVPLANAGSITGLSSLCTGATLTLADTATGGIWTSTGSSISVAGGVVTGISAGTDTVKYTVANSCGTVSANKIITVNPLPIAGTISGSSGVCVGSTITLTDAAPGGVWTSGGRAAVSSGIVTGLIVGVDTVKYTVANSCGTVSAIKIITVNPLPVAGTITGSSGVCVGSAITLTDAAPGGVWTSGGRSAVSSGIVTGLIAGVDTVKYTIANSCGAVSANKIITVNPLPIAGTITGSSGVCVGSTITLTDTAPGGAWTSGGGAAISSGIVTGLLAGADTVKYTVTNSCGTDVAAKNITIFPLPIGYALTGGGVYCSGGVGVHVGLTNSETGVNYHLILGSSPIGSAIPGTGTSLDFGAQPIPGTYTANAVNIATTCTNTMAGAATITEDSSLSVSISSVDDGFTATLNAVVIGGSSPAYQWLINGNIVPGATSGTFVWNMFFDGDIVTCIITDPNACGGMPLVSDGVVIHLKDVGVNQIASKNIIMLLPNPNKGTFTLRGSLSNFVDQTVSLTITNIIGQVVYGTKIIATNGNINEPITLKGGLARGIYMLHLHSESDNKNYQFVLED